MNSTFLPYTIEDNHPDSKEKLTSNDQALIYSEILSRISNKFNALKNKNNDKLTEIKEKLRAQMHSGDFGLFDILKELYDKNKEDFIQMVDLCISKIMPAKPIQVKKSKQNNNKTSTKNISLPSDSNPDPETINQLKRKISDFEIESSSATSKDTQLTQPLINLETTVNHSTSSVHDTTETVTLLTTDVIDNEFTLESKRKKIENASSTSLILNHLNIQDPSLMINQIPEVEELTPTMLTELINQNTGYDDAISTNILGSEINEMTLLKKS